METISFYDPKHAFGEFSNYYASPILIDGIHYPTVEHYFQAQKFAGSLRDLEYSELIAKQSTPNKAKILANQQRGGGYKWRTDLNAIIDAYADVSIRPDWENVKDNVVRKGVFQKFYQNPQLKQILLSTGNAELAEHTNRDTYWGDGGNGTGRNMLGKILMETRALLQGTPIPVSERNSWVIPGVLLVGEIDVPLFNQLGVNFLMDLSGEQIVTQHTWKDRSRESLRVSRLVYLR